MYNSSLNTQQVRIHNTNSRSLLKMLIIILTFRKYNNDREYILNTSGFVSSNFYLPKKKKSVIFLRAPYKNKLARLNILNLEYTSIISIKLNTQVNFFDIKILDTLGKIMFNTHKLKHTKTTIKTITSNTTNFSLKTFN